MRDDRTRAIGLAEAFDLLAEVLEQGGDTGKRTAQRAARVEPLGLRSSLVEARDDHAVERWVDGLDLGDRRVDERSGS